MPNIAVTKYVETNEKKKVIRLEIPLTKISSEEKAAKMSLRDSQKLRQKF